MSSKHRLSSTTRKWILGGAVAVLAAAATGLVMLALAHVQAHSVDREVGPVPTFAQSITPTPGPTTSDASSPSHDRSQERFLTVGSDRIWRGTAGECGVTAPTLERSADNGDTWDDVTPTYLGIGQLLSINAFAGDQAEIVASMGEACEVQALRTFTDGQFWESYPDVLADSRYIDPSDAGSIVSPTGAIAAPCTDVRGLSASGALIAITCDGTAYLLEDDTSWAILPPANVAAIAIADDEVLVANELDGCEGIELARYSGADGASATDLGCVGVADELAPMAIAISGDDVLVWSGVAWIVSSY